MSIKPVIHVILSLSYLGVSLNTLCVAEILAFNDPTKPIYISADYFPDGAQLEDPQALAVPIPDLNQLVVGSQRKVAVMGGKLYREGDQAAFGVIQAIEKNKVSVFVDNKIHEVYFRPKDQSFITYNK